MTTSTQSLASWLLEAIAEDEDEARQPQYEWTPHGSWTPAQVLADAEAKRRIIELHGHETQRMVWGDMEACTECGSVDDAPREWPCPTLRLLAVPYADREGYRDEWRP